jgi:hypothetical protein
MATGVLSSQSSPSQEAMPVPEATPVVAASGAPADRAQGKGNDLLVAWLAAICFLLIVLSGLLNLLGGFWRN